MTWSSCFTHLLICMILGVLHGKGHRKSVRGMRNVTYIMKFTAQRQVFHVFMTRRVVGQY